MSESSILSRVNRFVHDSAFYRDRGIALTEDERFLETVGINSKHVGEMISFIEVEFGVAVSSCEITEDNLGTLRAGGALCRQQAAVRRRLTDVFNVN